MEKLKFLIKLTLAYINRFKGVIFLGVILGILIFISVRAFIQIFSQRNVERIGITGMYRTENLPNQILELISEGLTKINTEGNPEPGLASRWETPDRGKTWIFYLKEGIKWQDGTPVTSDTLVYEFSDVTITRTDPQTIVFELKNPYSPFPLVLSKPTFKRGLLGTGEWIVEKVDLSGSLVQKLVLKNRFGDVKIYRFYPTTERTSLALKLGEVDKIIQVLDPSEFKDWKTLEISGQTNLSQVVTLFFNTKDNFLKEKSLRQALTYAIDKESFGYKRAISPISPNSWVYNPNVKEYKFDPERAKEFLKELPEELKKNLEIKLVTTPILLSVAEKIQDDWEKIGVKTILQVSSIVPTEFGAYLTILDIPKDPDQYLIWHSTQKPTTNVSSYSNPRIDKLLEDGRVELDQEERRKIYLDFQRFLLEDVPAAFLFHPTYFTISKK